MKIYKNFNVGKKFKNSAIAVGNFDGFHLGHQKVIKKGKQIAKKNNLKFGLMVFQPLPVMFFNKKLKNYRLDSLKQKISSSKKRGIDFLIIKKFDKKFSNIIAEDFIKNIIYKKINPKLVFVSNNFKFGYQRKGDIKLLSKLGKKYKYRLLKTKPYINDKKLVSSTRIRKALQRGDIKNSNKLLSRTWFIEGEVIKGKKIGRKLGYRTCNMRLKDYIMPKLGIYAVKVRIINEKNIFKGVAYLGSRPTFKGKQIFLEINIFGIKKNLYKKRLRVYFLKFIRTDKSFSSPERLVKQMNKDVILAKKNSNIKLIL